MVDDPGDFFSDYHAASDTFASYVPLTYTIEKAYFTGATATDRKYNIESVTSWYASTPNPNSVAKTSSS